MILNQINLISLPTFPSKIPLTNNLVHFLLNSQNCADCQQNLLMSLECCNLHGYPKIVLYVQFYYRYVHSKIMKMMFKLSILYSILLPVAFQTHMVASWPHVANLSPSAEKATCFT